MRISTTLCYLFASLSVFAQTPYQPVLEADRVWWGVINVVDVCNRAAYTLEGDTLIDGITYRAVNRYWSQAGGFDRPFTLRADSTHAKLYARAHDFFTNNLEEHLVMNLDLEVGDLFEHGTLTSTRPDGLFRVDSITIVDGRKVLTLSELGPFSFSYYGSAPNVLRFIEGIGPSHLSQDFWCSAFQDSTLIYTADVFGSDSFGCGSPVCETDDTPTREIPSLPFSLSPNPATTELTIELSEADVVSLQLFRMDGKQVLAQWGLTDRQHRLSVADLGPGVYLLTLTGADGRRGTRRVVAE